jgi:hypothetical protein
MQKIVINRTGCGYGLSKKAYEFLGLEWDDYGFALESDRSNLRLVECVETLGDEANGEHAELIVVEIPDGVKWYIYADDDGSETIHEEHRIW